MKKLFGRTDWVGMIQGEEHSFLLTNGLGGYCSQSILGANTRRDQGLLIAAVKAPDERWHYLTNIEETVEIQGETFRLSSQEYANRTKNGEGYRYLESVSVEFYPVFHYRIGGMWIKKEIVMPHGENALAIRYEITGSQVDAGILKLTPWMRFCKKDEEMKENASIDFFRYHTKQEGEDSWKAGGLSYEKYGLSAGQELYFITNGTVKKEPAQIIRDYYFRDDASDGRDAIGASKSNHSISMKTGEPAVLEVVYAASSSVLKQWTLGAAQKNQSVFEYLKEAEETRAKVWIQRSGFQDETAKQLAFAASQFLSSRDSVNGMTILAGYPFFADWGRDTMIAFHGCTLSCGQYQTAKSILRTFASYCRRGMMPNLFPEDGKAPLYNTVDASLLFIQSVYEYVQYSQDTAFLEEIYPVVESILSWYKHGTDYQIHMDSDGLLAEGETDIQLTWMDVRVNGFMPTPRHGKPVEINAYWYNALKIAQEWMETYPRLAELPLHPDTEEMTYGWSILTGEAKASCFEALAEYVKDNFRKKFINTDGSLKDVVDGSKDEEMQIRCNQIWALSLPYGMLEPEEAKAVLKIIEQQLYTPFGLRSLSAKDPAFHPSYGGDQYHRDLAYHQGTIWTYPLGAFYLAKLRYAEDPKKTMQEVTEELKSITTQLEGRCIGQLPEVYDGAFPYRANGCFAQAWSVAEVLRVYEYLEKNRT